MDEKEKQETIAKYELLNLEQKTRLINEVKKSGGMRNIIIYGLLLLGLPLLIIVFYEPYSEVYSSILPVLGLLYMAIISEGYRLDRRIDAFIEILDIGIENKSK